MKIAEMQKVVSEQQKKVAKAWCATASDDAHAAEHLEITKVSSQLTAVAASLFWLQITLEDNKELAEALGFEL
jgi:hypothetical protein